MDSHRIRPDLDPEKIAGFVLKRRYKDGGFSLAPSVPPSIQDTYYALNILQTLQKLFGYDHGYSPDQDKELKTYLRQMEIREGIALNVLYYYIWSCRAAGLKMGHLKGYIACKGDFVPLEDIYYMKRIRQELQDYEMEEFETRSSTHQYLWKTAKELWMWLYIMGRPNDEISSDILDWIKSCQNPDGGFGFLPNTTSFIENTCFCLRSLLFLGKEMKDLSKTLRFILSCYTGKGGFARKNGGTHLLDATYYAIQALMTYYLISNKEFDTEKDL